MMRGQTTAQNAPNAQILFIVADLLVCDLLYLRLVACLVSRKIEGVIALPSLAP